MAGYLDDAVYCLSRAAGKIDKHMGLPDVHDAVLYYAFAVERFFKAHLHRVNPLLVLEKLDFETAVAVQYLDKLLPWAKKKAEEKIEKERATIGHVLTFRRAMELAAQFSDVVLRNRASFDTLNHYRGIVVHRDLSEFKQKEAEHYVQKTFYLIAEAFAKELKFDLGKCLGKSAAFLKKVSEEIAAEENYGEKIRALLEKHAKVWADRKGNAELVKRTQELTDLTEKQHRAGGGGYMKTPCPACKNMALIEYELDGDYEDGEAVTTGLYATVLECRFCDLKLSEYEEIDHFGLNERLYRGGEE